MGRRTWGIKKMQHHVALTPNTNPAEQFTPLSSRIPETRRSKVKVRWEEEKDDTDTQQEEPGKKERGWRRMQEEDNRRWTPTDGRQSQLPGRNASGHDIKNMKEGACGGQYMACKGHRRGGRPGAEARRRDGGRRRRITDEGIEK